MIHHKTVLPKLKANTKRSIITSSDIETTQNSTDAFGRDRHFQSLRTQRMNNTSMNFTASFDTHASVQQAVVVQHSDINFKGLESQLELNSDTLPLMNKKTIKIKRHVPAYSESIIIPRNLRYTNDPALSSLSTVRDRLRKNKINHKMFDANLEATYDGIYIENQCSPTKSDDLFEYLVSN